MNRKTACFLVIAAAIAASAVCPSAHAQTARPARPFAVKFGVFFPSDNNQRDVFGKTWFSGGISYDFAQTRTQNPVVFQAYFDYTSRRTGVTGVRAAGSSFSNADVGDVTGRVFGFGPSAKFLLAPAQAQAQPYLGLGVGYYSAKTPVRYVFASATPGVSPSNGNVGTQTYGKAGGKLFAGYQLKSGFFGEADYTYIGEIDGIRPGGLTTRIGFRF